MEGKPPALEGLGGGGGLSSGSDLLRNSEIDPDSPGNPDQTRAKSKAKAKYTPTKYPAEFEAQWGQTDKTGSKFDALTVWERLGRPEFASAWAKWSRTRSWQEGFVPHVRTFLHKRQFEQEPEARQLAKTNLQVVNGGWEIPR